MKTHNAIAILSLFNARASRGSHVEFGSSGLPEVNADHIAASPFVCFIDGDEGGAGGQGGTGGAAGPGGLPLKDSYTKDEFNTILAVERHKMAQQLNAEAAKRTAQLEAELADLREKFDTASKGGAAAERALQERKLAGAEKAAKDREAEVAGLKNQIRDMKIDAVLEERLAYARLTPESRRFALLGFKADAKVEFEPNGEVAFVELDGRSHSGVREAFNHWLATSGVHLAREQGAPDPRTKMVDGRPLLSRSTEELITMGDRMRGRPQH